MLDLNKILLFIFHSVFLIEIYSLFKRYSKLWIFCVGL